MFLHFHNVPSYCRNLVALDPDYNRAHDEDEGEGGLVPYVSIRINLDLDYKGILTRGDLALPQAAWALPQAAWALPQAAWALPQAAWALPQAAWALAWVPLFLVQAM